MYFADKLVTWHLIKGFLDLSVYNIDSVCYSFNNYQSIYVSFALNKSTLACLKLIYFQMNSVSDQSFWRFSNPVCIGKPIVHTGRSVLFILTLLISKYLHSYSITTRPLEVAKHSVLELNCCSCVSKHDNLHMNSGVARKENGCMTVSFGFKN